MSFFDKLKKGLSKTKASFDEKINNVFKHFRKVDEELLEELEEALILSDVGFETTNKIIEELNSITLLKKDFIKNFSHEFKTPIVSIKGFSEILCNDNTLSEEEKMRYYQIIRDESTRLANLANMTLLLSKLTGLLIFSSILSDIVFKKLKSI